MDLDRIFIWILCLLYSLFSILRLQYRKKIQNKQKRIEVAEKKEGIRLLNKLIGFEVITFVVFVIWSLILPDTIVFNLHFPIIVRIIGTLLGFLALGFFFWVHRALGMNFSPRLELKVEQTLVQSGPYKYIRHPMYLAFFILHVAVFLISENFFIGFTWIVGLTTLIAYRIPREEKMMSQKFGNEYQKYIEKTGRFFPKLKVKLRHKNKKKDMQF